MEKYDVIVVWSGSGWLTVAIWLSGAWKKVALVEKWLIWWDCTNFWCIPSKAFLDISKKWWKTMLQALKEVRARRQLIRDEETKEELEKYGIDFFKWFASFKDENTILTDWKQELKAKNIVLSTWSKAQIIDIPWVEMDDILTNENVFELDKKIENLLIIGWWYIWCEMAEAFSWVWVNVTLVQRNKYLIPREELEARELLKKDFEEKWVKVITWADVEKAKDNILYVNIWDKKEKIKYDKILIALWRQSNIKGLELDNASIKYDRGIIVDKYNRTSQKNIYAIWDCVNNNPQFTHLANNEGRWVVRNILVPFVKQSMRKNVLPSVLYTSLEVASVWKTREELMTNYSEEEIKTYIIDFWKNDRSKVTNDTIGFIKINFQVLTWKILWATIMWKNAWEMLPTITLAMQNDISAYKLSGVIFPYPTKSELIKKVADKYVVATLWNLKKDLKTYLKEKIMIIIWSLVWLALIYLFYYYKNKLWFTNEELAMKIFKIVSTTNLWIIIYILIYTFRPIIFFPATILTFLAWALFWPIYWIIYTVIWENMSANLAYSLWKIYWNKVIKSDEIGFLSNLSQKANNKPFITVLLARILFLPFDLTNYWSWFLKIRWKSYFLATFVWIIPWLAIFILAWASFYHKEVVSFSDFTQNVDVKYLYISSLLFLVTIILWYMLKKRY